MPDARGRLVVLHAAPSRASSTASSAARRSPRPTTGRRPVLRHGGRRMPRRPARRAGAARRQRRGRGPRVLLARQLRRHDRRQPLLYGVDIDGDERYTDPASRDLAAPAEQLPDEIPRTPFAGATSSTRAAATSSTRPSTTPGAPTRSGGTSSAPPASDDVAVFHEPDERFWVGVGLTRSRQFLVIEAGLERSPARRRLLDAGDPTGEFARGLAAQGGRRVRLDARGDRRRGRAAHRAQRRRA